jgi:RNA polymerase sigma-70 factor (ECF subfamily)
MYNNNYYWIDFKQKYNKIIFSMIRKTFNSYFHYPQKEEIEDCYQNVLIKLIKNNYRIMKNYDEQKSSFNTWISIIIQSVVIDYLRNKKNDFDFKYIKEEYYEEGNSNIFLEIKNILTEREECILNLIFKEEKEIFEISELLNIKESTIRVLKKNALDKLKLYYKE